MIVMGSKPTYLGLDKKLAKIMHVNEDLKFRLVLNRCVGSEFKKEKESFGSIIKYSMVQPYSFLKVSALPTLLNSKSETLESLNFDSQGSVNFKDAVKALELIGTSVILNTGLDDDKLSDDCFCPSNRQENFRSLVEIRDEH